MVPFADAIRIAVGYEHAFKARLDDRTQRVVNDPVAKCRCADLAPLRFMNKKVGVGAWRVAALLEFFAQLQKTIRQLKLKGCDVALLPFAA